MRTSRSLTTVLRAGALLSAGLLLLIAVFLALKSGPFFLERGLSPLWQDAGWHPTEGRFNLLPMVAGSLLVTAGAIVLAAPAGLLLALFGRYYAPPGLARLYRGLMELLAGIPSVVYGFWGLLVLVPWINGIAPPGASVLAGCLVLALMVLPLGVLSADSAFQQVPQSWLNAADALALTRWGKLRRIAIPSALPGIIGGLTLQTGRALGETMAVLMVCGNVVQIPANIFEPTRTLTANIAMEMAYATGDHSRALFVGGLLLLLMTVLLFGLSARLQRLRRD